MSTKRTRNAPTAGQRAGFAAMLMPGFVALCLAVSLGGCASPWPNESADLSAQDSATALRVKAALIDEPVLAGAAIDVTMEDGRARLAGFVETAEQRRLAERIAGREDGVAGVINDIVVK